MSIRYAIGEVSRITGLSVKALRLYQEKGLLLPSWIDSSSGYRYYSESDVERARAIRVLRDLELTMDEIRLAFEELEAGGSISQYLMSVRERIAAELASKQRAALAIEALVRHEEQTLAYLRSPPPIVHRSLSAQRVATLRARGKYSDGGQAFPRLFGAVFAHVAGPPFCLLHEAEYKEDGADISWCVPVHESLDSVPGISLETLPAQRVVTIVHTGPWQSVGPSWARLFEHVRASGGQVMTPLRETYLRGPGPEGHDPASYVTELALPFL